MDQKKFYEIIEQFGNLESIESSEIGAKRSKENNTLPLRFKNLNDRTETCEDCGLLAENRRVIYQKLVRSHTRICCNYCKLCKDPDTGKFDIPIKNWYSRSRYFKKKPSE